jgi:hypothetical protein
VAGCCEFGDEPSGSCATELVILTSCRGDMELTSHTTRGLLNSNVKMKSTVFNVRFYVLTTA